MPIRLNGSTSGYSQLDAPAIAGDQLFTLPGTGGTLDRLNRVGNVLQVVNATYSTQISNSTSTFADTGLTATITPTSVTSKVLIVGHQAGVYKNNGNANNAALLALLRGSTKLIDFSNGTGYTGVVSESVTSGVGFNYLDSPGTTGAVTYKTQFANNVNGPLVSVQQANNCTSTITLMEIAA